MTDPLNSGRVEVLRRGSWKYGETTAYVWIIRQDWDFYFEEFYEGGPDVDSDGWASYAIYSVGNDRLTATSRSRTCLSRQEAFAVAETVLPEVEWLSQ